MHGVIPHIVGRPGGVRWAGPALGQHTEEVLAEIAGVEQQEIPELRRDGVI
jgi:formyl-CoA transferase